MIWVVTTKGDARCRAMADRHYTRQTPGHPQWTRPGYSAVLHAQAERGEGLFVWWRPKWESGLPGTERKDGLRCIECAIFRNETRFRSSDLIRDAVACLLTWEHAQDQAWPDGIITGVNVAKTAGGRQPGSAPGKCFLEAGFEVFHHPGKNKRADLWLRYTDPLPRAVAPPLSVRLAEKRRIIEAPVPVVANRISMARTRAHGRRLTGKA